jgi:hypothetical protein
VNVINTHHYHIESSGVAYYHTTFVFGKSHVQFSALRTAVLTEVFRVLLHSFQAFVGLVPVIGPQDFHFAPGTTRP